MVLTILSTVEVLSRYKLWPIELTRLVRAHPEIRVARGRYDADAIDRIFEKRSKTVSSAEARRLLGVNTSQLSALSKQYPGLRYEHNRYDPDVIAHILRENAQTPRRTVTSDEACVLLGGITRQRLNMFTKQHPDLACGRDCYDLDKLIAFAHARGRQIDERYVEYLRSTPPPPRGYIRKVDEQVYREQLAGLEIGRGLKIALEHHERISTVTRLVKAVAKELGYTVCVTPILNRVPSENGGEPKIAGHAVIVWREA